MNWKAIECGKKPEAASSSALPICLRGQKYLAERRMFRRHSTSGAVDPNWLQISFPTYHYGDVLRSLDATCFVTPLGLPASGVAGGYPNPTLRRVVMQIDF